jgi:hypothetical protein
MESIELWNAYGVKNVYAPRLETLGRLLVEQGVEEGATVDFGALREVETITLAGYWSRYVSHLALPTRGLDTSVFMLSNPCAR